MRLSHFIHHETVIKLFTALLFHGWERNAQVRNGILEISRGDDGSALR